MSGPAHPARPVRAVGDTALLVELDGAGEAADLSARLRLTIPEGVSEVVPALSTLMVAFDPDRIDAVAVRRWIGSTGAASAPAGPAPTPRTIVIPVTYDGADLAAVAVAAGLDVDEVIRRHTAAEYTAAFCGFAPGFSYLTGLDPALHIARRDRPRTVVPAGSVAIAGGLSAVYPRASPGGWQLLGRTTVQMWDLARAEPALAPPGTLVRFDAIG